MASPAHVHPRLLLVLLILLPFTLSYTPDDAILLNCGFSDSSADADGRKWSPDTGEHIALSSGDSSPAKASSQDPSLPSSVPYMTARVFSSESSYRFPLTSSSRHYLRLHFYPSSYNDLPHDDGYFAVTASSGSTTFTLLSNFSAHITAQALTQAYIVKEFSLPPPPTDAASPTIILTFTPAKDRKNSYAFVNGIEVISMPDGLHASPAVMVGFADQTIDPGAGALQTMYRLNVGGQYVAPRNDTGGLNRAWYDDSPYLYGAGFGVTFSAGEKARVQYPPDVPNYAAPLDVYGTARSMGPDPKVNVNYNLTWILAVDANFTYVVRLHFCELQLTKVNQRVFDVYVNNRTAQSGADVLGWTSSKAVPTYKDYAAYVADVAGADEELWVALHPSAKSRPEFFDAILNGMEVFKLSDPAGNLAGPNPTPSPMMAAAEEERSFASAGDGDGSGGGNGHVIGRAAGGAAAAGLLFAICLVAYHRKKRMDGGGGGDTGSSGWLPLYGNSHTSKSTISGRSASSHLSSLAASLCRHFSFAEIKQATRNFDESLVIGVGGFGKVYKGMVDGGSMKVAIKRSNPSSEQGVHEFQTEIEMLSKLRHRHLVSLIGYCEENGEMILVYDYMAHGTLREHLYKSNKPPLSWKQRLDISIGAARGLHYLHTGAKYTIIHRDVKTTNILVDEKWVAKVSDFGLSKTGPSNMNETHVSTMVKGSFGYLDPEYFRRQQLTDKSDVYSFGVVLFEVLCARPALNPSLPKEQVSLADWALQCQRKGTLEDVIDPHLKGKINPECLKKFAETAEKCLADHGSDRPAMGDVLWNLEFALQLQEGGEGASTVATRGVAEVIDENFVDVSLNEGSNGGSEASDGSSDTGMFSLLNHGGR